MHTGRHGRKEERFEVVKRARACIGAVQRDSMHVIRQYQGRGHGVGRPQKAHMLIPPYYFGESGKV